MSDKEGRLTDISSIQPDRLIKYRVSDDGLEAEVLLPGLWYTDFDQKHGGLLTDYAIAKIFESTSVLALGNGFGLYSQLKDKDHDLFLISLKHNFTRRINEIYAKSYWGKIYLLYTKLSVIHVGMSSLTISHNIHEYNTGEQVASGTSTLVYVGKTTRKPVPFPSYMDKIKKSVKFGQPSLRLPTPNIPATAFTCTVQAFASDIDANGHVNLPAYVKWCADVGTYAASKEHYTCFTGDIGRYPKMQIFLNSIGEGMVNDKFVVHIWQSDVDDHILHFVVTREDKMIFVAQFRYYTNASKL